MRRHYATLWLICMLLACTGDAGFGIGHAGEQEQSLFAQRSTRGVDVADKSSPQRRPPLCASVTSAEPARTGRWPSPLGSIAHGTLFSLRCLLQI
jgi:hypothetical protein